MGLRTCVKLRQSIAANLSLQTFYSVVVVLKQGAMQCNDIRLTKSDLNDLPPINSPVRASVDFDREKGVPHRCEES